MEKLRIIVGGFIGILPVGGVTWDYVQYPLGLSLLGHDVYYVEDTRLYPIYQKPGSKWDDCSASVAHLQAVMEYFGMDDRWAYRDEASGKCFGMSEARLREICGTTDVFINLSCSTCLRDEYSEIPARVLIDSDPMFTQIQYVSQEMFTPGKPGLKALVDAHNHHFTFGENVAGADCRMPLCNVEWKPTRQPVCLSSWKPVNGFDISRSLFTTLMNWSAAKPLRYENEEWGQKDIEFKKFFTIPSLVQNTSFAVVVNKTGGTDQQFDKEKIEKAGWNVLDPDQNTGSWKSYQQFIHHSYGEFSVAKNTYVKGRTGWFSCRSACYLASGKPVITQDTGWSRFIPSGKGLFAFDDLPGAVAAIEEVSRDYKKHVGFARQIAADYFDSHKVLQSILNQIT